MIRAVARMCDLQEEIEDVHANERESEEHLARVTEYEAERHFVQSYIRRHRYFCHIPQLELLSVSMTSVTIRLPGGHVYTLLIVFPAQEGSFIALRRWDMLRAALPELLSREHEHSH